MHDKISKMGKSMLVVLATLVVSVLLGIIGVSRRYGSIMPSGVVPLTFRILADRVTIAAS